MSIAPLQGFGLITPTRHGLCQRRMPLLLNNALILFFTPRQAEGNSKQTITFY